MVEQTVFGGVVEFMRRLGFYDVILPFLLVFALLYAILDKTKVLGEESPGEPKRSLNAIVAFAIAVLVVGATKVVSIINQAIANFVIVIVVVAFFLITISLFVGEGGIMKFTKAGEPGHKWFIYVFLPGIFIVILLIILHAIGWLQRIMDFLGANWKEEWVATILFLIGIAVFIGIIVRSDRGNRNQQQNQG
ncbi:hypothetical protein KY326_02970 [Candidatus Woesearchaeota archaeon]|nr:hypothetical protein [Candidatus Woesearchaeota archaeon]